MIFVFDYEVFLKDLNQYCFVNFVGQSVIFQIEIRLVRVSWQQELGVRKVGLVYDIREQ